MEVYFPLQCCVLDWQSVSIRQCIRNKSYPGEGRNLLSLPFAGSQLPAEGRGEQWLMSTDMAVFIQWGRQKTAIGWIYTLGIYWAYELHLIPDERKENFLSIHSIQPCLCDWGPLWRIKRMASWELTHFKGTRTVMQRQLFHITKSSYQQTFLDHLPSPKPRLSPCHFWLSMP